MGDEPGEEVDYSHNHVTPEFEPGEKCAIDPGNKMATIMFIGPVAGMPAGYWVGVQYDDKVGKNDGTLNGRRYFTCPPGHGGFMRATRLRKVEDPRRDEQLQQEREEAERQLQALKSKKGGGKGASGDGDGKQLDAALDEDAPPEDYAEPESSSMEVSAAAQASAAATWRKQQSMSYRGKASARMMSARDPNLSNPAFATVSGSGLSSAVVGSLAQFIITSFDGHGERINNGGDNFTVTMRGRGKATASQPAFVRTKLTDRGDGTYMCEYRPYMTGAYSVEICLNDVPIRGAPFNLNVITLRPDSSQCRVRGQALRHAVARLPHKFEVLFVDAIGHTAHAEDLDVYVEPVSGVDAARMDKADEVAAAAEATAQADGGATKTGRVSPIKDAEDEQQGTDAEDAVAPASPKEDLAGESSAPVARATGGEGSAGSDDETAQTSAQGEYRYKKLDAPTRQRHMQLWATRQAADKWLARRASEAAFRASGYGESGGGGGKKLQKVEQVMPSFTHELAADKYGFAFGGVDPGTLHAHGKLIKVHHVSYSVGLAGRYKLHVGLRNQMTALPGSPFDVTVVPGAAYAASTRLPGNAQSLNGIADEDWQVGLVLRTADMLGNLCIVGGANLTMALSKKFIVMAAESGDYDAHNPPVQCRVVDKSDGNYELDWCASKAGTFPLDVLIDGAHVHGSPISVTVRAAKPDVNRFVASGAGLSKAVAGVEAPIRIRVADRFDNTAEASSSSSTPIEFGLVLANPTGGVQPHTKKNAFAEASSKGGKKPPVAGAGKDDKAKPASAAVSAGADAANRASAAKYQKDQMAMDSLPYEGAWVGGAYEIRYIAQTAGQLELHLWCEGSNGGVREPLPGSPFPVHVSEGNASPVGSFVREAEASKQGGGITAGEHVVLKPQVHDQFHNATSAPEGALTAFLDSPGKEGEPLEQPKLRSGLGTYELSLEPMKSGQHSVHVLLHGEEIQGSPVSFYVSPAAPNSQKCYLSRPPDAEPTLINQPCDILLTTHDKYGNQLDRGGVRVDAKAAGVAASACTVEDNKNGTYTIRLTAGAPGEVKVTARIDSVEIKTLSVFFVREKEGGGDGVKAAPTPPLPGEVVDDAAAAPEDSNTDDTLSAAMVDLTVRSDNAAGEREGNEASLAGDKKGGKAKKNGKGEAAATGESEGDEGNKGKKAKSKAKADGDIATSGEELNLTLDSSEPEASARGAGAGAGGTKKAKSKSSKPKKSPKGGAKKEPKGDA